MVGNMLDVLENWKILFKMELRIAIRELLYNANTLRQRLLGDFKPFLEIKYVEIIPESQHKL